MVDHSILQSHLEHFVGNRGTALKWFTSYLKDRTFTVMINNVCSSSTPLLYRGPQGSVLGPLLFSLYMLPLGEIIFFHYYADDLQMYMANAILSFIYCITAVKQWLADNFLFLNH